jgi:hypothetical protein
MKGDAVNQPVQNQKLGDFREQMIEKHENVLRASMQLVPIANGLLTREIGEPLHKVLRTITRIVVKSNGAVVETATAGYGNDAAKIVRSMFEGAITIGYLRLKPELLVDYFDYYKIKRWQYYDFMCQEDPEGVKDLTPAKIAEMKAEYEAVRPKFWNKKGYVETSWCKDSVHTRAKAVGLGKYYPLFYAEASGMHHFDVAGLVAQAGAQALDVEVAPSERWVSQSLLLGFVFTFQALFRYNEAIAGGADDELEQLHNLIFGPSVRSRRAPGSGLRSAASGPSLRGSCVGLNTDRN